MSLLRGALFLVCICAAFAANATLIDFSGETAGPKANGYTVGGVAFHDTWGSGLFVMDGGHQSHGNAIWLGDDTSQLSKLRMVFPDTFDYLTLDFGNDEPADMGPWVVARLVLYLGGLEVGVSTMSFNADDIMNQTIISSGILFDEATFAYSYVSMPDLGNYVTEAVDNIVFERRNVPEPGSLVLLGIGLLGVAVFRRRTGTQRSPWPAHPPRVL